MNKGGILQLLANQNKAVSDNTFSLSKLFDNDSQQLNTGHGVYEQEKQLAIEKAYKEGFDKAEKEWNDKLSLLTNICDQLNHPIMSIDKVIQQKTVELSIAIAKQIVRRELSIDSGQIVSAVKQAIDLIPKDGEKINLHINPKDMQQVSEIFSNNDTSNKYNIIQDPSIELGGCKALTDYSLVDLTIDKQIASIAAQIFGDQRNANS